MHTQFKIDPATKLDGRKISPHGVITLPFSARLALGFVKGKAARLDVTLVKDTVQLSAARPDSTTVVRASPRGLLQLPQDAHLALVKTGRRYRLAVDDKLHRVVLHCG
jgi:hypothetical protein